MPPVVNSRRPTNLRSHSIKDQLDAINFAKEHGNKKAAFKYNTTEKSIRDWTKKEDKLKELIGNGHGSRKRTLGGGRTLENPELDFLLPGWISEQRRKGSRVTLRKVQKKGREIMNEMGRDTVVTYGSMWRFKERHSLSVRRKSTQNQYKPDDLVPKCQRFVLYVKKLLQNNSFSKIVAMDETPLFSDNMGNYTLDVKGVKEVRMKTTGNDKKFQTVVLSICSDGSKNKPCIIFKGKGKGPEARQLNQREDILVYWSENGWMNTPLTLKWIEDTFPEVSAEKKLLLWDSFKCHTDSKVPDLMKTKNILSAVCPGGCTSQLQTLDVCINHPFKSRIKNLFDNFMDDESQHSYTKGGNMRAPSRIQICDMVIKAWDDIPEDMITNSFKVCGQVLNSEVSDILAFRDGRTCSEGRAMLENLWSYDINEIDLQLLQPLDHENTDEVVLNNSDENDNMDVFTDDDPLSM